MRTFPLVLAVFAALLNPVAASAQDADACKISVTSDGSTTFTNCSPEQVNSFIRAVRSNSSRGINLGGVLLGAIVLGVLAGAGRHRDYNGGYYPNGGDYDRNSGGSYDGYNPPPVYIPCRPGDYCIRR